MRRSPLSDSLVKRIISGDTVCSYPDNTYSGKQGKTFVSKGLRGLLPNIGSRHRRLIAYYTFPMEENEPIADLQEFKRKSDIHIEFIFGVDKVIQANLRPQVQKILSEIDQLNLIEKFVRDFIHQSVRHGEIAAKPLSSPSIKQSQIPFSRYPGRVEQSDGWSSHTLPDEDGMLFFPNGVDPKLMDSILEYFYQDIPPPPMNIASLSGISSSDGSDTHCEKIHVFPNPRTNVRLLSVGTTLLTPPQPLPRQIRTIELLGDHAVWEYEFCRLSTGEFESRTNRTNDVILSTTRAKVDDQIFENLKVSAKEDDVFFLPLGSKVHLQQSAILDGKGNVNESYLYKIPPSLEVMNKEELSSLIVVSQRQSKLSSTSKQFVAKLCKQDNFLLSTSLAVKMDWELENPVSTGLGHYDELQLSCSTALPGVRLVIDAKACWIKELIQMSIWDNFVSVYQIDYSQSSDPRRFGQTVKRIEAGIPVVMEVLSALYGVADGAYKVSKEGVSYMNEELKSGAGGIGDKWRRLIRGGKSKSTRKMLKIMGKASNEEEAARMIADEMLMDIQSKMTPAEAREKLREFSVRELKTFGKSVLLDLLSFNDILTDIQRGLVFVNQFITPEELREYKLKVDEGKVDSAFKALQRNFRQELEDEGEDLNIALTHVDESGNLSNEKISVQYGQQQRPQALIGCEILCMAIVGSIVVGIAAPVIAKSSLMILDGFKKGAGGWGDKFRRISNTAKLGLKRKYEKKILKRTDAEIDQEIAEKILETLGTKSPSEIEFELQQIPPKELLKFPKFALELPDPKNKNKKVTIIKKGEDLLERLVRSQVLSAKQVKMIQTLDPTRIKEDWIKGTPYDPAYMKYIWKLSKTQLLALSDITLNQFVKAGLFTQEQVKWLMSKEVKRLTKRDLRGTNYKIKEIKKAKDLADDLPPADPSDFGVPPDKTVEALAAKTQPEPSVAPEETASAAGGSMISCQLQRKGKKFSVLVPYRRDDGTKSLDLRWFSVQD